MNFRPPAKVLAHLRAGVAGAPLIPLGWVVSLDDAFPSAPINLDYFPVVVKRMPSVGGRQLTPAELLREFRLHINDFVDKGIATFAPVPQDSGLWQSTDPAGAVVSIAIPVLTPRVIGPVLDRASVVTAESTEDHWIFSTLFTSEDLWHPVSGNRQFGFEKATDGSVVFFTRGADRTTSLADTLAKNDAFAGAFALWTSFQKAFASYVNQHGGQATAGRPSAERYDWAAVRGAYSDHSFALTHGSVPFLIPVSGPMSGWRNRLPPIARRAFGIQAEPTEQATGQQRVLAWQRALQQESALEAQRGAQTSARLANEAGQRAVWTAQLATNEQIRLQQAAIQQAAAHQVAAQAAAQQAVAHQTAAGALAQQAAVYQAVAQQAAVRQAAAQAANSIQASQQAAAQHAAAQAAAQQATAQQAAAQHAAAQAAAQQAAAQQAAARLAAELAAQHVRVPSYVFGPPQIVRQ